MDVMDPLVREKVSARAHELWEREGRPAGGPEAFWSHALDELRGEGAAEMTDPGDQALPGTVGTGENICRVCRGTGRVDGNPCPNCGGSGKVIEEIGGG
jgi:hypothetical protein